MTSPRGYNIYGDTLASGEAAAWFSCLFFLFQYHLINFNFFCIPGKFTRKVITILYLKKGHSYRRVICEEKKGKIHKHGILFIRTPLHSALYIVDCRV